MISKDGKPRRWSTNNPVQLNVDRGSLGRIADPRQLLLNAIAEWSAVETAALKLTAGESLSSDVEGLSVSQFNSLIAKDDGTNPVIFDSTGKIFETLYGARSGVVGVAGPSLIRTSDGTIVKGFAMFNGEDATEASAGQMQAAMTHELGHFINLEHSQINGTRIGGVVPGFEGTISVNDVETMFPVLVQTNVKPHPMASLHTDDIAAFSALYPTQVFSHIAASITGDVFDVDGSTALQGVNVIARNVDNPFGDAVSYVSGLLYGSSPSIAPADLRSAYELRGLTPNATYLVYIEEVSGFFRAGARVGPLDPPLDLDPTQTTAFLEFWNGSEESADDPPDAPLEASFLRIPAGATAAHTDFIFNGVIPRVTGVAPASASYLLLTEISVTGANLIGSTAVALKSNRREIALVAVEVVSANLLRARLPAGAVPGSYQVVVTSARGSSTDAVELMVTEPPPVVTGATPDTVENDRARTITVQGEHLLGLSALRLRNPLSPDLPLRLASVTSSSRTLAEVPTGVLPGSYSIVATNTVGDGEPSANKLFVLELAPLLSAETDPPAARNSGSKEVRILGANLAGTNAVELVGNGTSVPLVIRSTALNEVVVTVPGGLVPATYTVRITNTEGTATGPALFTVKKASGGGGGGCAHSSGGSTGPLGIVWIAALLGLGAIVRRRQSLA